jgi:[ribosomal protein S5]-alanine N-acetyltransferase
MKVKLRAWQSSDLENLVQYANNPQIANNLMDRFPHPYSEADGKAFLAFAQSNGAEQIFAIEVDGQAVGGISIEPQTDIHRKNAELGYWLAQPFWGQGIVSEAIRQVVDFAFSTYNIDRIFARPFGTNSASHRVLEKNHFILEGRFEKVLYKNN